MLRSACALSIHAAIAAVVADLVPKGWGALLQQSLYALIKEHDLNRIRAPYITEGIEYNRHQKVGIWMWDDLGWFSFFPYALGLEDSHI